MSSPTKDGIIHLLPNLNVFGGTPRKVLNLVTGLPEYRHIVFVWGCSGSLVVDIHGQKMYEEAGAEIVYAGGSGVIGQILKLAKTAKLERVGIVHSYFEYGAILGAMAKVLRPSINLVSSFVGFPAEYSGIKRTLFNFSVRKIGLTIFVSEYVRAEYEKIYPNISSLRFQVIPNGVDKRQQKEGTARNVLDRSDDMFCVVTTSGLVPWKNIMTAIEAVGVLRDQYALRVRLIVAGDGPSRDELSDQIRSLNLEDQVALPGYIEDVGGLLERADVYVHPALQEGFGVAVIEAMHAGLPIVAANAGALPEVIVDGMTGYLVPGSSSEAFARRIFQLYSDPALRERIGTNAANHAAREFSLRKFSKNHDNAYRALKTQA